MQKMLIAEDNPKNMRLLKLLLKPSGAELLEAGDGAEAVRLATLEQPDVILLDIQLPGKSGIEVLQELRGQEQFALTPIVALTAHAMTGDREKFLSLGFTGYLAKPINTRTFLQELKDIVAGAQGG